MLSVWEIEHNYIWGYNSNVLNNLKEIKYVYIFDLDYTLIKTKSGKKFPIDKTDWEFLHPNIFKKISKCDVSNSLIGIVSNQKGLKDIKQKNEWKDKIQQINNIIRLDFVFASGADDKFRKPLPGSFDLIKNTFVGVDWCKLIMENNVYYIGDAFGRENDFSDTDIKYAINNHLKFKTPELFFNFDKTKGKTGKITYPNIQYLTESVQMKLFEELDTIIKHNDKIIIITIGLPASGKSFLRKELIKKYSQFTYSNNDDLHDGVQSRMLIKKISTGYNYIIDDNTNLDKTSRDKKLKEFESYYKIGIWFDYEMDVCMHLNWMRMYWFGGKLLPKVTYYTLRKKFDSTNIEEGFDKFFKIDKVFREFNLDDKIKYYF